MQKLLAVATEFSLVPGLGALASGILILSFSAVG